MPENGKGKASKINKRKLKLFIPETITNEQLRIKYHKQYSEYKLVKVYNFQENEWGSKFTVQKIKNIDFTITEQDTNTDLQIYILWSIKQELQETHQNQTPRNHWHPILSSSLLYQW